MAEDLSKLSDEQLLQRYKELNPVGYAEKSVLSNTPTKFSEVAANTVESIAKGSAKGIVDLIGGWETLYNYLDAGNDPEAAKPKRILGAIKDLTGVDLETAPYRTPYNIGAAGAPAAAVTALGVPGLFTVGKNATTAQRALSSAGEFGVAGTTGVVAPLLTDSPAGQLLIQGTPYAGKGAFMSGRDILRKPIGEFPTFDQTSSLLNIGPMTPGELTGSRRQLAVESRVASSPRAENVPAFRQAQAVSTESYLDNLFKRSAQTPMNPEELTTSVVNSFQNYGKALSSTLRSDAAKDFNAAKKAGGTVDTTPILETVQQRLNAIPAETPGMDGLRSSLSRILDEYAIPAVPEQITPSAIVGAGGEPVAVNITPGSPAQARRITIDRLQKNLSAWGEAAYSGKADFGKGNIFEGVAPGQAKGIALDVLKGFKQSLDNAIDSGVPGAEQLKGARDKFAANIQKIDEFSNRPLVKAFDVERASDLVPEQVLTKLKNAPPSQRAVLLEVLGNNAEASQVLDTIRRSKFDEILTKARIPGAAENAPDFNIQAALAELSKKDGEFDFLFPKKADKNDALLVMKYMSKVVQNEGAGTPSGVAGSAAYMGTKAVGGSTQAANASKGLFDAIRDVINNPVSFSEVLFNPDSKAALLELAKKKSTPEKMLDATKKILKVGGIVAVRGTPMLSVEQMPKESANNPAPEVSVEKLSDEELIRRYNELK